jgi:hypothetical protein
VDKFAGDKLRVRLRLLKVIDPIIDRKYLLSRPDLRGLSILRCPRGTNFRVRPEEVKVLEDLIESRSASTRILGNGAIGLKPSRSLGLKRILDPSRNGRLSVSRGGPPGQ